MEHQQTLDLFVPGRVCLFGEHSDWAGAYRTTEPSIATGKTLICGTEQGIYAQVSPAPDQLILTATLPNGAQRGPHIIPMKPAALLAEARAGGYWSYIAGVAYQMLDRYPVGGLTLHNYRTTLPVQKGLSSSAAISVLAARAFNQLYRLDLSVREEMELAYLGETTTPSQCGRMDQGCAFGATPVLMTYDGDDLDVEPLQLGAPLHLIIVDLGASKDTPRILSDLNRCYPATNGEIAAAVRELFGRFNHTIIEQAVAALKVGDSETIGRLMTAAQTAFDRAAIPACPSELTAPILHRVLDYLPIKPHVWGGKGVGSQGDGCAQFVARSAADQAAAITLIERDLGMECLAMTLAGELIQG